MLSTMTLSLGQTTATVTITQEPLAIEELLAIVGGARVELDDAVRTTIAASRRQPGA
jgi:hypothetical protein